MIRDFESEDEIIEKVKNIKGNKFSHENLKSEIKILRDFHFIASL
ncbi:hypothetical protein [Paratissierella segnis]|nr:hypothetical protein [Paratissierella segnis]